jgi:hypothetical protein
VADIKVPYVPGYGNITKALQGIKTAQTPDRFTLDFLSTKLSLKSGSARPVIPFLKKTGFLGSDGAPTALYKRFRNASEAGAAAAEALRRGYAPLYEINEYTHDLTDPELKGVIVQATGLDDASNTVKVIQGSFKALKAFANFSATAADSIGNGDESDDDDSGEEPRGARLQTGLNLGYTINLNLPATSDIAVFNAIFRSLREHLLD